MGPLTSSLTHFVWTSVAFGKGILLITFYILVTEDSLVLFSYESQYL